MVDLASPVGVVNLASPVCVVNLATPVSVVTLVLSFGAMDRTAVKFERME